MDYVAKLLFNDEPCFLERWADCIFHQELYLKLLEDEDLKIIILSNQQCHWDMNITDIPSNRQLEEDVATELSSNASVAFWQFLRWLDQKKWIVLLNYTWLNWQNIDDHFSIPDESFQPK